LSWIVIPSRRTHGVSFAASCRIESLGLSMLVSYVGVTTICVATLHVRMPAWCHIASRGFSWLDLVFVISFPASCLVASLGTCSSAILDQRRDGQSDGRFAESCLWLPSLMFAADDILNWRRDVSRCDARRRFASVVSCGFPGVMNFESAWRRHASRR
jgi:hypothetical protein